MPSDRQNTALTVIRVLLATVMFVHGATRVSHGSVGGFGEYLDSQHIPLALYVAWAISLFEIIGSVLLAVGFHTWIIALMFTVQLAIGVYMVHAGEGWFVVGAGRNGMEFSVVLIVSMLSVAYASYQKPARSFRSRK